jgi:hypothetical protein
VKRIATVRSDTVTVLGEAILVIVPKARGDRADHDYEHD